MADDYLDLERVRLDAERERLGSGGVVHDMADAEVDSDMRVQAALWENSLGDALQSAMRKAWEL
jgi:hypothetical protein